MPPLEPDTSVVEIKSILATADVMSQCHSWQTLCDKTDESEARSKIIVGLDDKPWDEQQYSLEQLAEIGCQANLIWPVEGERTARRGTGGPQAEEQGAFELNIRRYVIPPERDYLAAAFLWFASHVSKLQTELIEKADLANCPIIRSISRTSGPAQGSWDEETAQGEYFWVHFSIEWGDELGEEGL